MGRKALNPLSVHSAKSLKCYHKHGSQPQQYYLVKRARYDSEEITEGRRFKYQKMIESVQARNLASTAVGEAIASPVTESSSSSPLTVSVSSPFVNTSPMSNQAIKLSPEEKQLRRCTVAFYYAVDFKNQEPELWDDPNVGCVKALLERGRFPKGSRSCLINMLKSLWDKHTKRVKASGKLPLHWSVWSMIFETCLECYRRLLMQGDAQYPMKHCAMVIEPKVFVIKSS